MFLDLFFIWLINVLKPKDRYAKSDGRYNTGIEDNWIILEDVERSGRLRDLNQRSEQFDRMESDPFLNGDYYEGPDW